uniref:CCHC-type domain-containing protein n=1 Tax=Chenopodium quinoa TaxID=63459 RepID=A0A803LPQ6_CHEQI
MSSKANVVEGSSNTKKKKRTNDDPNQSHKKKFKGKSYGCGKLGHKAKDCRNPNKKKENAQPSFVKVDKVSEELDDHNVLLVNSNFDPQSYPQRLINIQRPISYYKDENGERVSVRITKCEAESNNNTASSVKDWYTDGVCKLNGFIDAAFRSSLSNEAYLDYAPGTANDRVINGPLFIPYGFPSLKGTAFADWRNTIFESGFDAAFASHRNNEAYLFKGDSYALINFAPGSADDYLIGGVKKILPNWPSLQSILPRNNRGIDR